MSFTEIRNTGGGTGLGPDEFCWGPAELAVPAGSLQGKVDQADGRAGL